MKLFVGLGNPGSQYALNRHNVGFMAVDAIAATHDFPSWRKRFQGLAAEAKLAGEPVLLFKPMTFMNESGRAVGEAVRFYKLELGDVVVFHDELDLAPGKVRVKLGGGGAGHNGLKSLTAHLGNDYLRVRIGIGHPGHKDRVIGHVMRDFPKKDYVWLEPLLGVIAAEAPYLAEGAPDKFQSRVAHAMQAETEDGATAAKHSTDREGTKAETSGGTGASTPESKTAAQEGPLAGILRRLFGV